VEHYTTSEAVGPLFNKGARPEIVIPVYRHGVHQSAGTPGGGAYGTPQAGSPQALLSTETLHMVFGTGDVTARSVSQAKYAACMALPPAARGPASCGDYVHQAGLLTYAPSTRRLDVIIPIVDDGCPEPESESFTMHLYLPGGVRIRGYGYSVTVRIDDDDLGVAQSVYNRTRGNAWPLDDVSAAAVDGEWQPLLDRTSLCAPEDVPLGQHANQHMPPLVQPAV
jgi:hypothetical protein